MKMFPAILIIILILMSSIFAVGKNITVKHR